MADAAFMNCCDGRTKLQSLVRALTDCDRRRSYYLSIATCYCTPQAVRDFIDAVQATNVRLAEIYLYVDRRIAISIGQEALAKLENRYPGLLWVYAVRTGRLFHTKGFCLAAYNGDEVVHGRLAIGSANLTNPGLTERHGNVETLAVHSDIATIEEFLDFFNEDGSLLTLDELTEFSPDDTADYTDFQYALLTSGLFSHNWSPTLTPYFSVRFRLNEEGKRRAREGLATVIDSRGFDMDMATIAKPYFEFDLRQWQPTDKGLIRNFGIECFLGHWIPKSVLGGDAEDNELFDRFRSALFAKLESEMKRICREILEDCKQLVEEEGIIDEPETDPAQIFRNRIGSLKDDPDKLRRIWSGRSFFQLPYDPGDADAIKEAFDDILLTALGSRRRNGSMHAVLTAEEEKTLEPLQDL